MLRIYLTLSLLFMVMPHASFCMEELPLQPMHNPEEVIEKFNNTIVLYTAATEYLTGPKNKNVAYSTNPWVGFVSYRISYDEQPLVRADYSIKKLMSSNRDLQHNTESLLTNWSVYEGNLKMRAATAQEVEPICKQWCPAYYDFDYENWANIKDIADKYCCAAIQCCWNVSLHQK